MASNLEHIAGELPVALCVLPQGGCSVRCFDTGDWGPDIHPVSVYSGTDAKCVSKCKSVKAT